MRAAPDSLPTLELATDGAPGLVIHAGTGSFVAARAPDGTVHYAGGTGWRFGDPGSGYELGRRAISRALLELQGWLPASRLGPTVREHTQLGDAADARAITRYFYAHEEPNRVIAALAPAVLRLATEGDHTAHQVLIESANELLDLATPRRGEAVSRHAAGHDPHRSERRVAHPRDGVRSAPTAHPRFRSRRSRRRRSRVCAGCCCAQTSIGSRRDPDYRPTMLVRFTKNAPSAKADTLTCIRADGTSTTGPMPKQGVLPHDAIHYVRGKHARLAGGFFWADRRR